MNRDYHYSIHCCQYRFCSLEMTFYVSVGLVFLRFGLIFTRVIFRRLYQRQEHRPACLELLRLVLFLDACLLLS